MLHQHLFFAPVFMNKSKKTIRIFTDRPGHVEADRHHLNSTRQLPSTGRSMVGRCSTAKIDFGLLTPDFPLFMNKQRRLLCALEEIQRFSRVREWTPQNAPRIRAGATKKVQKAE